MVKSYHLQHSALFFCTLDNVKQYNMIHLTMHLFLYIILITVLTVLMLRCEDVYKRQENFIRALGTTSIIKFYINRLNCTL